MVVREQQVSQASVQCQWESTTMMNVSRSEEEDSSGSSDLHNFPHDGQQKRKSDETDDEREMKRRKNREAAKRCRDKKQKQTEDLKFKNCELEKENCQLAKQRDELIRKCRDYQHEIQQHKQEGCVVPHFNPPYNLDHLLQPSSPPSPSFSESAPSTSSCPSPAPSISPGLPARYSDTRQLPLQDGLSSGGFKFHPEDISKGPKSNTLTSVSTSTSLASTQCTSDSNQLHYLRVRNKDGSHKILCLDHENYIKVMHKLKSQRAAAVKNEQSEPVQSLTSASADAPGDQSQQIPFQREQPEPQARISTDMIHSPFLTSQVEEQEASAKSGQKLDTCEDLLSILRTHVKDTGNGFELTPVNEDEVPIKKEPLDEEYEQISLFDCTRQTGMTGIKQEDTVMPELVGTWTSTGQQIRTSLDTLTNQDDMSSPSTRIQNIVQYLEGDEHTVTVANTVLQPSQTAMQKLTTHTSSEGPAQIDTYVTSSASMGALNKMNIGISLQQSNRLHVSSQQQNGVHDISGQQQVISSMQTIKRRSKASSFMNSASCALSGKPQTALAAHSASQETSRMKVASPSRTDVTSPSGMKAKRQIQPITNTAGSSDSKQTTHGLGMQGIPGQHLTITPSLIALQQDSTTPYHDLPSSTIDPSAITPLHLQDNTATDILMSESTSQIAEYLKKNSIETMDF